MLYEENLGTYSTFYGLGLPSGSLQVERLGQFLQHMLHWACLGEVYSSLAN